MKKLFIFNGNVLFDFAETVKELYEAYKETSLRPEELVVVIRNFVRDPQYDMDFVDFCKNSTAFGNFPAARGMAKVVERLENQGYDMAVIAEITDKPDTVSKYAQNLWRHYGNRLSKIMPFNQESLEMVLQKAADGYDKVLICDAKPVNLATAKETVTMPIWLENPYYNVFWYEIDRNGIKKAENLRELYWQILHA